MEKGKTTEEFLVEDSIDSCIITSFLQLEHYLKTILTGRSEAHHHSFVSLNTLTYVIDAQFLGAKVVYIDNEVLSIGKMFRATVRRVKNATNHVWQGTFLSRISFRVYLIDNPKLPNPCFNLLLGVYEAMEEIILLHLLQWVGSRLNICSVHDHTSNLFSF